MIIGLDAQPTDVSGDEVCRYSRVPAIPSLYKRGRTKRDCRVSGRKRVFLLPFGASLSMSEFSTSVPAAARPNDFVSAHAPCLSCLFKVNKYALAGSASTSTSACLSLSALALETCSAKIQKIGIVQFDGGRWRGFINDLDSRRAY